MERSIKVTIVERKNTPTIISSKWVAIVSFCMLITSVIIENKLLALAFGPIFIGCILFLRTKKRYSTVGFAIFSKDKIKINLKGINKTLLLNEINSIKIKYGGYVGENYPNPQAMIPKDGTGNFIYIFQESGKYSFELLFDKPGVELLNGIILIWKQMGINVTLIGGWGYKVGSI